MIKSKISSATATAKLKISEVPATEAKTTITWGMWAKAKNSDFKDFLRWYKKELSHFQSYAENGCTLT